MRHSMVPTLALRSLDEQSERVDGGEEGRHLQLHFTRTIVRTKRTGKRQSQSFDALLFRWWLAFRFTFPHRSTAMKEKRNE